MNSKSNFGKLICIPFSKEQKIARLAVFINVIAILQAGAADGTWKQTTTGGLWSNSINWSNGIIASGDGFTANFNSIDIPSDLIVHMNSSYTLSALVFGDTSISSPGSWTIDNYGNPANVLNTGGAGITITINQLAAGKTVSFSAGIAGSSGLTINGAGTININNDGNSFSGPFYIATGIANVTSLANGGGDCSIGNGSQIQLGVNASSIYPGTGRLQYVGTTSTTCNRSILIGTTGGAATCGGGTILNNAPNTLLTLSGNVTVADNSKPSALTLAGDVDGDGLLSGSIQGSPNLGLIVAGGTWTLTGNNTHTGLNQVTSGQLMANNSTGSATGTGDVIVSPGAIFGGTGAVAGNVTYANAAYASLSPSGALNISGSLILNSNVVYLNMAENVGPANYTLATYSVNGSSGNFSPYPIIQSGSFTNGAVGTIIASGGVVKLCVSLVPGVSVVPVAPAFGYNSAGFARHEITTVGNTQYFAFYGLQTNVTIARRVLGTTNWTFSATDYHPYNNTNGDGHKTISIGISGDGYLHCCWGMHDSPLQYARSVSPGSLTLTTNVSMTGQEGNSVSYPAFMTLPNGDMLMFYRQGYSGAGDYYLNHYSSAKHSWFPVHTNSSGIAKPFIKGITTPYVNSDSAYPNFIVLDSSGKIQFSWCWREDGSTLESNHDEDYAYSSDSGLTWHQIDGTAYSLPITKSTGQILWAINTNHNLLNQQGMTVLTNGNPAICAWFSPGGISDPIQYQLGWLNNGTWQTTQIGDRSTTNLANPGPPIVVCDKKNNIFVVYGDQERFGVPTLAWSSKPDRSDWHVLTLSDLKVYNWYCNYDSVLWGVSNKLHLVFNPSVPSQMISVLELDPSTIVSNAAQIRPNYNWVSTTSGAWNLSANWANGTPPAAGGNVDAVLSFGGSNAYNASNDLTGIFQLNQISLGNIGTVTCGISGGTLDFQNNLLNNAFLIQTGTAPFTISNPIILDTDLAVTNNGATINLSGSISGNGGLSLDGTGQLNLTGSSTFIGITTLNGGTLALGNNALNNLTNFVGNGGTIQWLTGSTDDFVAGAKVRIYGNVTLDPNGNNVTLSGTLGGSGGIGGTGSLTLNSSGSGSVTLAEGNSYIGNTTISKGTLAVNGSIATGNVYVNGSGVLSGNGKIYGPVTIQSGGTLAPGVNGIATLIISNAIVMQAGSTTSMQINGNTLAHDQIAGASSIGFGGTLTVVNLAGTSALTNGASLLLFSTAAFQSTSFATMNLPALPSGLVWDTSWLKVDGSLRVKTSGAKLAIASVIQTLPMRFSGIQILNGLANISYSGVPDSYYLIQSATNVLGPWFPLCTNLTGTNGIGEIVDPNATNAQKYYRLNTQ